MMTRTLLFFALLTFSACNQKEERVPQTAGKPTSGEKVSLPPSDARINALLAKAESCHVEKRDDFADQCPISREWETISVELENEKQPAKLEMIASSAIAGLGSPRNEVKFLALDILDDVEEISNPALARALFAEVQAAKDSELGADIARSSANISLAKTGLFDQASSLYDSVGSDVQKHLIGVFVDKDCEPCTAKRVAIAETASGTTLARALYELPPQTAPSALCQNLVEALKDPEGPREVLTALGQLPACHSKFDDALHVLESQARAGTISTYTWDYVQARWLPALSADQKTKLGTIVKISAETTKNETVRDLAKKLSAVL